MKFLIFCKNVFYKVCQKLFYIIGQFLKYRVTMFFLLALIFEFLQYFSKPWKFEKLLSCEEFIDFLLFIKKIWKCDISLCIHF